MFEFEIIQELELNPEILEIIKTILTELKREKSNIHFALIYDS